MVKSPIKSKKGKKMISYDAQRDCIKLTDYEAKDENRNKKVEERESDDS